MSRVQTARQSIAQAEIRQLAQQHGIAHQHSELDEWGETVTRLSGDETELDETQWLLVELGRRGILTGSANVLLHAQYLSEQEV